MRLQVLFCVVLMAACTLAGQLAAAQKPDPTNTAANCTYMLPEEREMIHEINKLRSNPKSYLQYLEPELQEAKEYMAKYGKGSANYSLSIYYKNGQPGVVDRIDTTWHYQTEERVRALQTLVDTLKRLKPLSILKPDTGIYTAVKLFAKDQDAHDWKLYHTGSDGSSPWDRITRCQPRMSFGNENICGSSGITIPRGGVLQLLIDSGIPGYGHRYNLLDPQWTHVAVKRSVQKGVMTWWIQNFGVEKK
jgi:uncharacterized protein YkwD